MKLRRLLLAFTFALPLLSASGQTAQRAQLTPPAASMPTLVPALVPFSGVAETIDGKPIAGEINVKFLIYKQEQGGEPLWVETQNTYAAAAGSYKVQLGAGAPKGLPEDLFRSGEARWLEVQVAGGVSRPRTLLTSVPYALKAADAATLGGLPASAFARAGTQTGTVNVVPAAITPNATATVTTTGGSANHLTKFSGTNTVVNSILFDNGKVGVNTTSPGSTLTVNGTFAVTGTSTLNGSVVLPAVGSATSAGGKDSQQLQFLASAYNSSSKAVVQPHFVWQAEPTGNNSSGPGVTLNLLSASTSATAGETGFHFNQNGTIQFAPGQTFGATSGSGVALNGTSTSNSGVKGNSSSGDGILGTTAGTTLHTAGVFGIAGTGNISGFNGIAGVWGDSNTHAGVLGTSTQNAGVQGVGFSSFGVQGISTKSFGVFGQTNASSGNAAGVYGYSTNRTPGVLGRSTLSDGGDFYGGGASFGIQAFGGSSPSQGVGYGGRFFGGAAIDGVAGGGVGLEASGGNGADYASGTGVIGFGGFGATANGGTGGVFDGGGSIDGFGGNGIYASAGGSDVATAGYAAYLDGNVQVTGTLSAGAKNFRIDHPLDPANKYLSHTSVESSEMMNIYSGNVTTDDTGLATVSLPDWFESVNTDFRYQLTAIGQFAQAIVQQKIENGKFAIRTSTSHVEVSWQVTAVRHDAYAKAHPLVVEEIKPAKERGFYLHPELFGQSSERQMAWSRSAEMMRRLKEARATPHNGNKTLKPGTPASQTTEGASGTK